MGSLDLILIIQDAVSEVIKWLIIIGLSFFGTQIYGYFKLKKQVAQLAKDVNAIGALVRQVKDKIHDEYIEHIFEESEIKERVAKIEGMLLPKPKNGQA